MNEKPVPTHIVEALDRLHEKGGRWSDAGIVRQHIESLEEQFEAYAQALRDVHEYQCGCDQPGRLDLCVAQPVVIFEILREASSPASRPPFRYGWDEAAGRYHYRPEPDPASEPEESA